MVRGICKKKAKRFLRQAHDSTSDFLSEVFTGLWSVSNRFAEEAVKGLRPQVFLEFFYGTFLDLARGLAGDA